MTTFSKDERDRQSRFKISSPHFSILATDNGEYKGHFYPFCLPVDCASENLFREIRDSSIAYFERHRIKWHDGKGTDPSNHLCDSQVCCLNFLAPFSDKPHALIELLRPLFPSILEMVRIEDDRYVAFEWIGEQDYLGEKTSRSRKRTRGANCTSADAAVMFTRKDGKANSC